MCTINMYTVHVHCVHINHLMQWVSAHLEHSVTCVDREIDLTYMYVMYTLE